jgi:large subunit ribosomal protein L21
MISNGEKVEVDRAKLANAKVKARVAAHGRDGKIVVFKHKRRKGYRRKQGHRQQYTELAVENIEVET